MKRPITLRKLMVLVAVIALNITLLRDRYETTSPGQESIGIHGCYFNYQWYPGPSLHYIAFLNTPWHGYTVILYREAWPLCLFKQHELPQPITTGVLP